MSDNKIGLLFLVICILLFLAGLWYMTALFVS